MLVIVVTLFAVCWLPLQTYNVLQDVFPYINEYHYINIIWFCCDWLAMSNSCYNPFIYGIYNEKFKREFRQRFPWRSRGWSSSPVTESLELDRSYGAPATGRCSLRSSGYDWRRSYSATPAERRSVHRGNTANLAKASLLRSATTQRSLPHRQEKLERIADVANGHGKVPTCPATTEMYIFPAAGGVLSKKDITSSMEELCSL